MDLFYSAGAEKLIDQYFNTGQTVPAMNFTARTLTSSLVLIYTLFPVLCVCCESGPGCSWTLDNAEKNIVGRWVLAGEGCDMAGAACRSVADWEEGEFWEYTDSGLLNVYSKGRVIESYRYSIEGMSRVIDFTVFGRRKGDITFIDTDTMLIRRKLHDGTIACEKWKRTGVNK